MAKFSRESKLSSTKRQELVLAFCQAIQSLKSDEEVAKFLTDLLSPQEVEMLAKRLQIAEQLLANKKYEDIRASIKVSYGTIARVATWLGMSGEGFKIVISRKKSQKKEVSLEEKYDPYSSYNFKRRYSQYYWPQLLLEKILQASDAKHKQKITTILQSMVVKRETFTPEFNKQVFASFAPGKTAKK